MAIPVSEIVKVTPRVLTGASQELIFNGLILTTNEAAPVDTLLTFYNASSVATYFGYNSDEHKAATTYFNGYNNSLTKPSSIYFFRHLDKDAKAFLRGAYTEDPSEMLTNLKSTINGEIYINLGSDSLHLIGLNFSKAASLSDCAIILQDQINSAGIKYQDDVWTNATVSFSSLTNSFTIMAGVSGPEISISECTGGTADVMKLSETTNAICSLGGYQRDYATTLDKVLEYTGNFVSVTTAKEVVSQDDAIAIASWINNQYNEGNQFLYVYYTTDVTLSSNSNVSRDSMVGYAKVGKATVVNAGAGKPIIETFVDKAYEGVCSIYGSIEYAAFLMGMAASIDWNQTDSTISFAFKTQAGLSANVTDLNTAKLLDSLYVNYVGNYASRNDSFVCLQTGRLYGAFAYIDTYLNSTWLNNALQSAIMSGFASSTRVPYTSEGYSMIRGWCDSVINKAINNGIIEPGVTLSETQINELAKEAGTDISDNLQNNGYHLQIGEADADTRQQRSTPPCQFWYTYGGSVQKLSLPVTTVA